MTFVLEGDGRTCTFAIDLALGVLDCVNDIEQRRLDEFTELHRLPHLYHLSNSLRVAFHLNAVIGRLYRP
jgi:hypothetical protein